MTSTNFNFVPITGVAHGEKPEKFGGVDFKRWQQKMLFYLTTLNLAKFLTEDAPTLKKGEIDKEKQLAVDAWKHAEYLCKNYILNALDNTLYNMYSGIDSAKNLWTSLENKYKTDVACSKKFLVGKFLNYKMVNSKTVISQVQEIQVIIHDIHAEKMTLSESFQVAEIIEKLPPSWRDFKNYLKHKRKEIKLEELVVRLGIEENNKIAEKISLDNVIDPNANVVERKPQSNKKRKVSGETSNQGQQYTRKFNGKCFNCNKMGHQSKDCRKPKNFQKKKSQAHVTELENLSDGVAEIDLSA